MTAVLTVTFVSATQKLCYTYFVIVLIKNLYGNALTDNIVSDFKICLANCSLLFGFNNYDKHNNKRGQIPYPQI